MLKVGDRAPAFSGRDQDGKEHSLEALLEGGPLVLYFYPRDFTPVCTKEACYFRDAHEDLAERGARVVGVSSDDEASHRSFAQRNELNFPLLADPDGRIARDYDASRPLGLGTARVTYVIGRDGTVRGAFHHELRAKKHVEQVLDLLARS